MQAAQPVQPAPGLDDILAMLRASRATGAIHVISGSRQATLYMLFGHLYHAEGPSGTGEAVVADARSWSPVAVHVDSKAKLPQTETITGS